MNKLKISHNKALSKLGYLLSNNQSDVLKMGQDLFDLGFDNITDGFWIWDINTNVEYYSPRFIDSLGYSKQDCDNTTKFWMDRINKEDLNRAILAFNNHKDDPNSPYFLEVRYNHKEGKVINILCSGTIVNGDSDNPIMIGTHEIII